MSFWEWSQTRAPDWVGLLVYLAAGLAHIIGIGGAVFFVGAAISYTFGWEVLVLVVLYGIFAVPVAVLFMWMDYRREWRKEQNKDRT